MSHAPASPPADPLSSPNAASARSAPPTTPHYLGPSHTHPAPAPAPAQALAPEPVDRRWDHCTTPGPRLTLALTVARQTQLDAAAPPEPPAPEQPGPEALVLFILARFLAVTLGGRKPPPRLRVDSVAHRDHLVLGERG